MSRLALVVVLACAPAASWASGFSARFGGLRAVSSSESEAPSYGGFFDAGWAFTSLDGGRALIPHLRYRGTGGGAQSLGAGVRVLYSPASDGPVPYVAFTGSFAPWTDCVVSGWCGRGFEAELDAGVIVPLERARSLIFGLGVMAPITRDFPAAYAPAFEAAFTF